MTEIATSILDSTNSAFAYIDPGSGSAIISAIVGIVVAAGLALKTYWYKFKGLFSSKKNSQEADSNTKK